MQDDDVGWDRAGVVERLPDHRAVLAALDHDHYARDTVRPHVFPTTGWRHGDAVAWVGVDADERHPCLCALGEPPDAHVAVEAALGELPDGVSRPVLVTMPEDVAPLLGRRLEGSFRWWFRTATTPPQVPDPPGVCIRELPAEGDERIARLIGRGADQASAFPGDPAVRRWVVVEESGDVIACAADTSGAEGVGHMGAVAVAPETRRRGLGMAVVGWLTRDLLLGGCDVVTVGMFPDRVGAARLYDRLGYRTEHRLVTGTVGGQA